MSILLEDKEVLLRIVAARAWLRRHSFDDMEPTQATVAAAVAVGTSEISGAISKQSERLEGIGVCLDCVQQSVGNVTENVSAHLASIVERRPR